MATKKTTSKSSAARKTTSRPAAKATARKAAPRTTAKAKPTTTHVEAEKTTTTTTAPTTTSSSGFKIKKSYVILVIVILLVGAALWFFRSYFVAATVNGQPISRLSVLQESEKQSGKQVLTTLVRNTLIEQEARKENVTVSDQEINDEIKKLEGNLQKQGQKLDQVLSIQGMSRDDLRKLIRLDKLVGKMVGKDINITDQQVNDYIDKNKDQLPQGQSDSAMKASVKEQLRQQQLNDKVRVWLENLQKKSNVKSFVPYYSATN